MFETLLANTVLTTVRESSKAVGKERPLRGVCTWFFLKTVLVLAMKFIVVGFLCHLAILVKSMCHFRMCSGSRLAVDKVPHESCGGDT